MQPSHPSFNTDLIIVGAGAAGLMAAATAGESSLRCIVLERRHRPGLKLLMCGNNRCNISHAGTDRDLAEAYGEGIAEFMAPSLRHLSPGALRNLFTRWELPTITLRERIYPQTEKADDVLHCFTDRLRDLEVPLMTNCPVEEVAALPEGGFIVKTPHLTVTTRFLLIATGGLSYPKTGAVGDGYRFAETLGLTVVPTRPGLAGIDLTETFLPGGDKADFPLTSVTVFDDLHRRIAQTRGNLLADGAILRGTAIFDAVRQIAHRQIDTFSMELDFFPDAAPSTLNAPATISSLGKLLAKQDAAPSLASSLLNMAPKGAALSWFKAIPLPVAGIRPLKEAILTAGGVCRDDIHPDTMEARAVPGLYFAGEVMDIDGPTGGYNLHAAFATARLAIQSIASHLQISKPAPRSATSSEEHSRSSHFQRPARQEEPRDATISRTRFRNSQPAATRENAQPSVKRSKRGDRWEAPQPPSWRRRPN